MMTCLNLVFLTFDRWPYSFVGIGVELHDDNLWVREKVGVNRLTCLKDVYFYLYILLFSKEYICISLGVLIANVWFLFICRVFDSNTRVRQEVVGGHSCHCLKGSGFLYFCFLLIQHIFIMWFFASVWYWFVCIIIRLILLGLRHRAYRHGCKALALLGIVLIGIWCGLYQV